VTCTDPNTLCITTTTGDRSETVLQTCSDLASGSWTNMATNDSPGFIWTVSMPVAPGNAFFRALAR
jgi:hypothetical protein